MTMALSLLRFGTERSKVKVIESKIAYTEVFHQSKKQNLDKRRTEGETISRVMLINIAIT